MSEVNSNPGQVPDRVAAAIQEAAANLYRGVVQAPLGGHIPVNKHAYLQMLTVVADGCPAVAALRADGGGARQPELIAEAETFLAGKADKAEAEGPAAIDAIRQQVRLAGETLQGVLMACPDEVVFADIGRFTVGQSAAFIEQAGRHPAGESSSDGAAMQAHMAAKHQGPEAQRQATAGLFLQFAAAIQANGGSLCDIIALAAELRQKELQAMGLAAVPPLPVSPAPDPLPRTNLEADVVVYVEGGLIEAVYAHSTRLRVVVVDREPDDGEEEYSAKGMEITPLDNLTDDAGEGTGREVEIVAAIHRLNKLP